MIYILNYCKEDNINSVPEYLKWGDIPRSIIPYFVYNTLYP